MELLKKKNINKEKTTENLKKSIYLFLVKYKSSAIYIFSGFLISRISVFGGISPFSLPYLLSQNKNILAVFTSLLGIISNKEINSYKYILINLFGLSLNSLLSYVFPDISENKRKGFCVFTSSMVFSFIFIMYEDYVVYDILLVIFESVLTFLSYFVIKKGVDGITKNTKKYYTLEESITTLVVMSVIIAGIGNVYLPFSISLKNVICITLVYMSIIGGNVGLTAQMATFMGIAAGIGTDYTGMYIATYAVNGVLASCFSKYGKIAAILGFTLGNVVMNLASGDEMFSVVNYLEILISSGIYIIIPDIFFKKIFLSLYEKKGEYEKANTIKEIAIIKLDRLSYAFKKLSDTISTTVIRNGKTNLNNISNLCDAVGDKVCKKCALRFYCWQKDYDLTVDALSKAIKHIEKHGEAKISDFPEYFRKKCTKPEEILNSLTTLYEIYRLNYVWQKKLKESTKVYRDQFIELSEIVASLKDEINNNPYFDKELSLDVASKLEKEGYSVKNAVVIKDSNEKMQVELLMHPCQNKEKCYEVICEKISEVLDAPFYKASGKCSYKECKLVYKECAKYAIDYAVKTHTKTDSEKSGDNYSVNTLDNTGKYIAICDGSGSGKEAYQYSYKTLKLLEEFMKTGFSRTASVKLINSSLICNSDNEFFSTVDLGIVDFKTGELETIKKGACPTYIKHSNGEYEVIRNDSLPLGVVRNENSTVKKTRLYKDDIVVMATDGICDSLRKEDWIIDALKAIKSDDIECIADTILKIALCTDNKNKDDMTIIVSKLKLL